MVRQRTWAAEAEWKKDHRKEKIHSLEAYGLGTRVPEFRSCLHYLMVAAPQANYLDCFIICKMEMIISLMNMAIMKIKRIDIFKVLRTT